MGEPVRRRAENFFNSNPQPGTFEPGPELSLYFDAVINRADQAAESTSDTYFFFYFGDSAGAWQLYRFVSTIPAGQITELTFNTGGGIDKTFYFGS